MAQIVWSLQARQQFNAAYKYILKDSFQNAEKVKQTTQLHISKLSDNPEIHRLDKYKENNDGSFRAFEIYHYRIAYQITNDTIIIIRMRHTKMEPQNY